MSPKWRSSALTISISWAWAAGRICAISARSLVLRVPETTSSPWALSRKSPEGCGAPVISSRLKATPEPESSPLLPKTICCTLTAVPQSSGMPLSRRYSIARAPFQEEKTAPTARHQLLGAGRCGNSSPVCAAKIRLNSATRPAQVRRLQLGVERDAALGLQLADRALEQHRVDPADDVAEHLHEAPVGVPGEALVGGARRQALDRLLAEAEVEHGVHHPRHRLARAGADRDEQRVLRVAELAARVALERRQGGADLLLELGRQDRRRRRGRRRRPRSSP